MSYSPLISRYYVICKYIYVYHITNGSPYTLFVKSYKKSKPYPMFVPEPLDLNWTLARKYI